MSPTERALVAKLQKRAYTMRPELARRYLAALDAITILLTEAELVRAINNGTAEALIFEVLDERALNDAFSPLRELIDRQALQAGSLWTGDLPRAIGSVAFGFLDPLVVDAVRQLDTRVIQAMKAEVRETVRQAVREGIEAGVNPRTSARRIRSVIGLAPNQEEAVRNFRRLLEAGDREALTRDVPGRWRSFINRRLGRGKPGLSAREINIIVDEYREKKIALNARTHTRTVALDTHRLAQRLSWQSQIDQGIVDASRLRRRWVSVGDDRVRPLHRQVNGETIGWYGRYSTGETVPGESTYNCRCIERVILLPAEMRLAA